MDRANSKGICQWSTLPYLTMKPTRTVKTADTLFDIIERLQERDNGRVTEIANDLQLAKSTVYDHLATLETKGYVVKEGERYRLALRFLDHGTYVRDTYQLGDSVRDPLSRLAADTGEAAWFLVEEKRRAVYLYRVLGDRALTIHGRIGKAAPLHAHAGGKAIFAQFSDERFEDIVDQRGLREFTDKTITDVDSLVEELTRIREQEYASEREELTEGIASIAAPVFRDGMIYGSVCISGPSNRVIGTWSDSSPVGRVLAAAEEISVRMTHQA